MASQLPINLNPEITLRNNQIITTSQSVAAFFVRRHDDVLRKIRVIDCSDDFRNRNFTETSIYVPQPRGGVRKEPTFEMTKNGFVFLVMGFTGKKAAQFKEAYIAEFDRMESELIEQRFVKVLPTNASTEDLIALRDILQKVIHEGEFIPAGHTAPEYSFPKTRKPRSKILEDFIHNPKNDTLHQLLTWMKKDGHNVEEAERVLHWVRDYMHDVSKKVEAIRTHAQYIEFAVNKL